MSQTAKSNNANSNAFWQRIQHDCHVMARHAFNKGLTVPSHIMTILDRQGQAEHFCAKKLTSVHNCLANLVSPAKPETIRLMDDEANKGSIFLFLGRVPLIRRMMLVSIISLITLIALSLSEYINNENMISSMFDMEGTRLLYVQAILLASAAMGASFSALFKANSYVTAGCYDAKYESSYWVRFVVGLIAGIILTQLIPIDLEKVSEVAGSSLDGDKSTGVSHAAVRITMALVGGFSSNLVYKILHKIVETIQSFILPEVAADPEVLKNTIANQYKEEQMQYTYHLVQELLILQQKYADQEAISQQQLQGLLANYLTFITSPKEYV